ncbi:hypothetical protein ACWDR2_34145 [Streptomyces sp. NPDC003631]|uniref:hypothetical protein n=1 Tax=unclassified Streptomyces TaxID=2593676 RepID=UPI00369A80ED
MRKAPGHHPVNKHAPSATDEVLKEFEEQSREGDTDTRTPSRGGTGDPLTPSPRANKKTAQGRPSAHGK